MRTSIVTPPDWTVSTIADGERDVIVVDGGLRIEIDPLVPLPADRTAWADSHVRRDVPPGAVLDVAGHVNDTTSHGAPMTVVLARVRDASGALVEIRQVAFYVFGDRGGVVAFRMMGKEAATRFANQLEPLLRDAHPVAQPARLDDVYE